MEEARAAYHHFLFQTPEKKKAHDFLMKLEEREEGWSIFFDMFHFPHSDLPQRFFFAQLLTHKAQRSDFPPSLSSLFQQLTSFLMEYAFTISMKSLSEERKEEEVSMFLKVAKQVCEVVSALKLREKGGKKGEEERGEGEVVLREWVSELVSRGFSFSSPETPPNSPTSKLIGLTYILLLLSSLSSQLRDRHLRIGKKERERFCEVLGGEGFVFLWEKVFVPGFLFAGVGGREERERGEGEREGGDVVKDGEDSSVWEGKRYAQEILLSNLYDCLTSLLSLPLSFPLHILQPLLSPSFPFLLSSHYSANNAIEGFLREICESICNHPCSPSSVCQTLSLFSQSIIEALSLLFSGSSPFSSFHFIQLASISSSLCLTLFKTLQYGLRPFWPRDGRGEKEKRERREEKERNQEEWAEEVSKNLVEVSLHFFSKMGELVSWWATEGRVGDRDQNEIEREYEEMENLIESLDSMSDLYYALLQFSSFLSSSSPSPSSPSLHSSLSFLSDLIPKTILILTNTSKYPPSFLSLSEGTKEAFLIFRRSNRNALRNLVLSSSSSSSLPSLSPIIVERLCQSFSSLSSSFQGETPSIEPWRELEAFYHTFSAISKSIPPSPDILSMLFSSFEATQNHPAALSTFLVFLFVSLSVLSSHADVFLSPSLQLLRISFTYSEFDGTFPMVIKEDHVGAVLFSKMCDVCGEGIVKLDLTNFVYGLVELSQTQSDGMNPQLQLSSSPSSTKKSPSLSRKSNRLVLEGVSKFIVKYLPPPSPSPSPSNSLNVLEQLLTPILQRIQMSLSSPSDINKTILERCQNDVQDLIQMNLAVAETFSPSVGKKGKILVGFEKFQSPKRCRGGNCLVWRGLVSLQMSFLFSLLAKLIEIEQQKRGGVLSGDGISFLLEEIWDGLIKNLEIILSALDTETALSLVREVFENFSSLLSLSFSPSLFCIVASLCDVVPSEASLSEWAGRAIDLMFEGGMREGERQQQQQQQQGTISGIEHFLVPLLYESLPLFHKIIALRGAGGHLLSPQRVTNLFNLLSFCVENVGVGLSSSFSSLEFVGLFFEFFAQSVLEERQTGFVVFSPVLFEAFKDQLGFDVTKRLINGASNRALSTEGLFCVSQCLLSLHFIFGKEGLLAWLSSAIESNPYLCKRTESQKKEFFDSVAKQTTPHKLRRVLHSFCNTKKER